MSPSIAEERLRRQRLTSAGLRRPVDVVRWFGAVQAQEYGPARWGIAQRMAGAPRDGSIREALDRGEILRTHVLRPTWHFVAPDDIRWMLALTGPRIQRAMAGYERQHGLDPKIMARALSTIERALAGRALTRVELGVRLARRGIALKGTALALVTMRAELEGVICSGPYEGRHLTYALLDERAPTGRVRPALADASRDEMVAELVRRFFQSHGPATTRDFAWWSGLTVGDAKRGLEITRGTRIAVDDLTYWTVGRAPARRKGAARAHLLPIYDEYIVAYRDRVAVPHPAPTLRWGSPGTTFQHALIVDGQIAGTWKLRIAAAGVHVQVLPLGRLTRLQREAVRLTEQALSSFHDD